MIRVLHVSPTDGEGGAAVGAYKLHKAVQEAGIDSMMLVLRKYSRDPSVITRRGSSKALLESLRDPLDRLPLRFYRWEPHNWWSVGWLPFDIKSAVDRVRPDIVHFHWAGRGAVPIRAISRLRHYPLVWTLRDMWPLTGGCHYAGECAKYTSGCGSCPQLGSKTDLDISRWQWWRKHRYWRDAAIAFVPLSNWMASCARQSPLTFNNEITVIPNGVNVERFKPLDQAMARSVWGLPADRKVVLFGALHGVKDPRKGFEYLAEALRLLMGQGWEDRIVAVAFGGEPSDEKLGFPIRYIGRLHDDASLALLYASADVMVVPSVYENAAKTALEAMACGTPVAAFANTGQVDIVDHKLNGYLAENLSALDLARGIAWCLQNGGPGSALSQQAREKVLMRFDISKIAQQHIALYERLLAAHSKVGSGAEEDPANDAEVLPYTMQDGPARFNDGSVR